MDTGEVEFLKLHRFYEMNVGIRGKIQRVGELEYGLGEEGLRCV